MFLLGICLQVKFLDHPMGEGQQCLAKKKDLRPALDWSIIKGWTVPLSAVSSQGLGSSF